MRVKEIIQVIQLTLIRQPLPPPFPMVVVPMIFLIKAVTMRLHFLSTPIIRMTLIIMERNFV